MYRSKKYYAEACGISKRGVERRFAWIRNHPERYPGALVRNGTTLFCDDRAWEDMIRNMNRIDAGIKV